MCETGRAKDILVQAFLNEGLAIRNRELTEHQKQVAMAILARRNDIIARKKPIAPLFYWKMELPKITESRLLSMGNRFILAEDFWKQMRPMWSMDGAIPVFPKSYFNT